MKKETISILLTIAALLPSTLFLLMSVHGILNIVFDFYFDDLIPLVAMLFGICGYVGLVMNLSQNKEAKSEAVNLAFLFLGVLGVVIFITGEGGSQAWNWIITMKEPGEWLLAVGPIVISIMLILIKGKRLVTLYRKS
ncbi:hypothetical protein SAMN05421823_11731 [Catalinimonas alkaloidigena]|uniref:Uncharacterized protein n=1 Tax=Catalinimonas alkaloidigena TaxID=1075417 RepID=A0A1G9UPA4_9BACT|nr:hypothetical protein [Catalinimonas alkaloidigena]SDM61703.1 hypothetical protein SAMN05421823_11731 [Catalinimonas alkaloidigena]